MTVSTIYAPIEYAGDAETVAFPVPWMFLEANDLRLTKIDNATDAETDVTTFTATGVGEPTGGTVTLPAPLGTGYTLRIARRTDRTQEMDLQPQGRFPAETVERSVDKLTLIVQELDYEEGAGGGGGTRVETIVTNTPDSIDITKTGTQVEINFTGGPPTGAAGGDLAGTYPDPIVKQLTGVGSQLLRIQTNFEWAGWTSGFDTDGGRGISPGYAWFGEPGSQVHLPVWGANDAWANIYWTTDNWASSVHDNSLTGIVGPSVNGRRPPCIKYAIVDGVASWVVTGDQSGTGLWWYAEDIAANYDPDGTLKVAAWQTGTTAPHLIADIGQGLIATCVVGNHPYITRTLDWVTWTDVYTGTVPIGGIDTDGEGNWIAVERDTGVVIASDDDGLTWTNPAVNTRTSEAAPYASAASVIPTGAVVYANGVWLLLGAASYAYSFDGINWTIQNSALGSFYGVGFDGIRIYATNPDKDGEDSPVIYQLLASSIPAHRQIAHEKGFASNGPDWLPYIPDAAAIGTGPTGRVIRRDVTVSEAAPVGSPGATDWLWFVVEPL